MVESVSSSRSTTPLSTPDTSGQRDDPETMAEELLQSSSAFREIETRGYGLNLDNPDFRQMLVDALATALQKFKEQENITGELSPSQKKTFIDQFIERSENLLMGNASLASNLSQWMNTVADWPGWRDSVSETEGRNVLNVYQSRLDKLSDLRKNQYDDVKALSDKQKLLNSARAKVLSGLKSTDSTTNSETVGWPAFSKEETDLMDELGISYPDPVKKMNESIAESKRMSVPQGLWPTDPSGFARETIGNMNVLSEKLSNAVKSLGDDSQLKTTDLQDSNSKHNSNVEAINKFLQQMYDISKAQLY